MENFVITIISLSARERYVEDTSKRNAVTSRFEKGFRFGLAVEPSVLLFVLEH